MERPRFALISLVVLLPIRQAGAQTMGTGTITGTITDPSGARVAGAQITAVLASTNITRAVTTNGEGLYVFPALQIGTYVITAEHPGFKTFIQENVSLDADTTGTVNVALELGNSHETVTASAAPPGVETENGEIGALISGMQLSELSLNGRNFSQFLALNPGVASTQTGRRMGVGQEGNPLMAINGGRINGTKFTYDGILAMSTDGNRGLDLFPPMGALAEVQIKTSNVSADKGSYGYGLVNVITKAGSSQFHGNLYEVLGNSDFDARDFFDNQRPPFHENIFGFTLGGPIYIPNHDKSGKSKTFFFISEGWNLRQGPQLVSLTAPPQSTFTATTLTAAQRQGIFATKIADPTTGAAFSNGMIPSSRIDPNATALLNLFYPLPNRTGSPNYVLTPDSASRWREDLARVDHQFSDNVMFTLRYAHDNWYENQAIFQPSNASFPTQPGYYAKPGYNAIARLSWTMSATTVNVFTAGFSRNAASMHPLGAATTRSGLTIPELKPGNMFNAPPDITISGYSNIGIGLVFTTANNLFEWKDEVTHIVGSHTLKTGFDILRLQNFDSGAANTQGAFTFNGSYTGNGAADFLLGRAFMYTESSVPPNGYFFSNAYEMYLQDDWRFSRNLTLNLGLRCTMFKGVPIGYDKYNNLAGFSTILYSPAQAPSLFPDGEVVPGTGNLLNGIFTPTTLQGLEVPRSLLKNHYIMPGPRFGFAWSPFGNAKTVIRGGYGIFYHWDNDNQQILRLNPPFTSSVSIYNTSLSNPEGGRNRIFPPNLQAFDAQNYYPQVQQWSFDVQREFPGQIVVSVAYVGNHAVHLDQTINLNQPQPSVAVVSRAVNVNTVRPYLGYGTISYDERNASAEYHALQLSATRRFDNGLAFQVSYTFSKSLVWGVGQNQISEPDEEGLNSYDQPQNFTFNWVYDLPFFKQSNGWIAKAFGGWEASGDATFVSGFPFTVTVSGDRAGVGGGTQRPNLVGPLNITGNVIGYFNTAAFALEPLGTYGNEGSNIIRGPGIANDVTLNVYRNFAIGEHAQLRIGGEFFNVFNHPNFSAVGNVVGSSTYGDMTAALDGRHVQLSARLTF
jgi:hypothetical protein